MPVQQTSLRAYEKALESINRNQKIVLEIIRRLKSATNSEIAFHLGWSINRVTPRVLELRKMELVELKEKRKCKVTNNLAMVWKEI